MYKVLIVDDEIITAQFLQSLIPWGQFNCAIVGTALTANQAINITKETYPDIIFMDIRMPETDGIRLSEKILKFHPKCKIIVLTAYQDFDTAKDAIRLGIRGFMLKHELSAETLSSTLTTVIEDISSQRKIQNIVLKKWIYDIAVEGVEVELIENYHNINEMQYVFILAKTKPLHQLLSDNAKHTEGMEIELNTSSFPVSKDMSILNISHLGGGQYGFLYGVTPQVSTRAMRALIVETAMGIESVLNSELATKCLIVAGGPFSTPQELSGIGLKSVLGEVLICKSGIFTLSEYFDMPIVKPIFSDNFADTILGYIHIRNKRVSELIMKPFLNMPNRGRCNIEDLSPIKVLLENFEEVFGNLGRKLLRQNQVDEEESPEKIGSLPELINWLCDKADELINMQENLYSRSRSIAMGASKYIESFYGKDLSSSDIAEHLQISSGYLRSVFKKEFNCTVGEYLLNVRLNVAKHLLLEKEKRINEIASECGFKTSQHFSAVFKSAVGVSPKGYMNGIKGI